MEKCLWSILTKNCIVRHLSVVHTEHSQKYCAPPNQYKECVAVLTGLYKKNGAVSCVTVCPVKESGHLMEDQSVDTQCFGKISSGYYI